MIDKLGGLFFFKKLGLELARVAIAALIVYLQNQLVETSPEVDLISLAIYAVLLRGAQALGTRLETPPKPPIPPTPPSSTA